MKIGALQRTGNLRLGDFAAALALSLFFWRALIPAGYMPDPESGLLKLCSAGITVATGDKAPGDGNPDAMGTLCAFAATPSLAPPVALDFGVAAPPTWGLVPAARLVVQRARDGPLRTQSARAPPFSA